MNTLSLLAHAGHVHDTAAESTKHFLADWYVALPLFALALVVFAAIVHFTFRKTVITISLTDMALLILGFTMYNTSAIVSVLSITLGLVGAAFLAFSSLEEPQTAPAVVKKHK